MLSGFLGSGFRELLRSAIYSNNVTAKENFLLVKLTESIVHRSLQMSYSCWEIIGSKMVSGLNGLFIH